MKTLNKTLSLVLVLVMVLGMFGVASAKEFVDSADVKYVEAVDVMTGIGAINGYTDGSIKPTATITREEAAKLVAYSILGADVAKNLATGATGFTDVDAGRWSAPFISYLVGKGIINGMGDGTFAPTANVTGYQFAKMMLCAAGYGVNNEYTGSSWQLNVAVDANKLGVYDDATGVDYTKAATREEAMLYAFNGLTKVKQVTYNTVFGGYVAKGSVMNSVDTGDTIAKTLYGAKLDHEAGRNDAGKIVLPVAPTATSAAIKGTGFDTYGNPADVWTFKGEQVGAYAVEPVLSYTKDMTSADGVAAVTKALNGYTVKNVDVVDNVNAADDGLVTGAAAIAALTGNGVEVNVYANGTDVVRVVVIREHLAKVTYVDSTKEQVTIAYQDTYLAPTGTTVTTKGFGTVKVDDYVVVAVNAANDAVAYLAPVTTVKGVSTSKSTRDDTITIDGKAYGEAAACLPTKDVDAFTVNSKGDAELLLDNMGYILKANSYSDTAANVIAVTDNYSAMDGNKVVPTVEGKNSLGETVTYAIDINDHPSGKIAEGTIVEVISTSNGKYKFVTPAATNAAKSIYVVSGAAILASDRMADVEGSVAKDYYYASNVKFIFATTDKDGSASAATDHKVSVLSGVQETKVPAGATGIAYYITKDVGTSKEVVAVFYNGLPKSSANVATDLVYLAAVDGVHEVKEKTYYKYLAVQNGALVPECYGFAYGDHAITSTSDTAYTTGAFYTISKNDDGIYTFEPYTDGNPSVTPLNSLNVLNGFVPYSFNDAKTAVSAFGANLAAAGARSAATVDISGVTPLNLDKKAPSSAAEINASLTKMVNDLADATVRIVKVPTLGVIYNDKGVASMVYFAEKEYDKDVANDATALRTLVGAFNTNFGYTIVYA